MRFLKINEVGKSEQEKEVTDVKNKNTIFAEENIDHDFVGFDSVVEKMLSAVDVIEDEDIECVDIIFNEDKKIEKMANEDVDFCGFTTISVKPDRIRDGGLSRSGLIKNDKTENSSSTRNRSRSYELKRFRNVRDSSIVRSQF